jgi:hypothetical protein
MGKFQNDFLHELAVAVRSLMKDSKKELPEAE